MRTHLQSKARHAEPQYVLMGRGRSRIAFYVRVSKGDEQEFENQLPDLEHLAVSRGFDSVVVYAERQSAAKRRPMFAAMLRDAAAGVFDVVGIWALDRFGRNMAGNMADALKLADAGVGLVSVREVWLDTTRGDDDPTRSLLLAIFSWVAEQERRRLSERTKAGLDRARSKGKQLGRKRLLSPQDAESVRAMRAEGRTQREIAVALRVPRRTVRRVLAGHNGYGPRPPETQASLRERRRQRAREARVTVTVGTALRARLRRIAADTRVSESRLALSLVREALHARTTSGAAQSAERSPSAPGADARDTAESGDDK